jgi:PhnB protein
MKLNPYLSFHGNCEEAMNFYKDCLNGNIEDLMRYEGSPMANESNKNWVLHSVLKFSDGIIMGSDSNADKGKANGTVSLSMDFESVDQMEKVFNALSSGGQVTMALQDTFWGAKFGMCTDKYGISWLFNCDKK